MGGGLQEMERSVSQSILMCAIFYPFCTFCTSFLMVELYRSRGWGRRVLGNLVQGLKTKSNFCLESLSSLFENAPVVSTGSWYNRFKRELPRRTNVLEIDNYVKSVILNATITQKMPQVNTVCDIKCIDVYKGEGIDVTEAIQDLQRRVQGLEDYYELKYELVRNYMTRTQTPIPTDIGEEECFELHYIDQFGIHLSRVFSKNNILTFP